MDAAALDSLSLMPLEGQAALPGLETGAALQTAPQNGVAGSGESAGPGSAQAGENAPSAKQGAAEAAVVVARPGQIGSLSDVDAKIGGDRILAALLGRRAPGQGTLTPVGF